MRSLPDVHHLWPCSVAAMAVAGLLPRVGSLDAQTPERIGRPAHTFSIVARDSVTGELGVAVQSHWFSVGAVVPWAESGVGAVATQSFIEPSYGPLGLDLMRAGRSAPQALAGLLAADPHPEVRQVGMVDADGRVAVHTGALAIAEACNRTGAGFTVQANLMLKPTVCDAMYRAYTTTRGDLVERLMAALDAAQGEGGDIRGRQSAALLVVRGQSTGRPWADRLYDLRVEDSPEPLQELRRLLTVGRAYNHMQQGDDLVTEGNIDGALAEYAAGEQMLPDRAEPIFWHAVTLASVGRVDESLPLFRKVFEMDAHWATLVSRLPAAGLLPKDPKLIARILAVGPQ